MRTAREVFAEIDLTAGLQADQLAADVVVEAPMAPHGQPRRFEGRDSFLAHAAEGRARMPFRLDAQRISAVHETTDSEVLVVEYDLDGTALGSGRSATASFVTVVQVREGLIVGWREYQDTAAIARALS